jgi:predicted transcriptional regulator
MKREQTRESILVEIEITVFHPDRKGIRKVLGDLEAEIMELIWARPQGTGITVRDIFEVLYQRRQLAYTTVMSTMSRLAKKKLLQVEKRDQTYIYTPTLTESEFISWLVSHILEDLFVSFAGPTQAGIDALSDPNASTRAHQLLEEITRRRAEEEGH